MTVLVYRAGVLAADGRMTAGDRIESDNYRKVAKGPGVVGGFSGRANNLPIFKKWIKKGGPKNKIPDKSIDGIVVYQGKKGPKVYTIDDGKLTRMRIEFHTKGSGADVAMGALEAGATAEEAVAIAARRVSTCGGKVQSVKLDG